MIHGVVAGQWSVGVLGEEALRTRWRPRSVRIDGGAACPPNRAGCRRHVRGRRPERLRPVLAVLPRPGAGAYPHQPLQPPTRPRRGFAEAIRPCSWLSAAVWALIGPRRPTRSAPDRLHRPGAGLRCPARLSGQGGSCGGEAIDRVRLALNQFDALAGQIAGQPGAIGTATQHRLTAPAPPSYAAPPPPSPHWAFPTSNGS